MSLWFDVAWFDSRLAARGLDRAALAHAAGLNRSDLQALFANARAPSAFEVAAFAEVLNADLVEVSLKCGIAARGPAHTGTTSARIESIEARLDAMDAWLAEFEELTRKRA